MKTRKRKKRNEKKFGFKVVPHAHNLALPVEWFQSIVSLQSVFVLIAMKLDIERLFSERPRRRSNSARSRIGAELFFESPRDLFGF